MKLDETPKTFEGGKTLSSAELDFCFDKRLKTPMNITEMTAQRVATEKIHQHLKVTCAFH